MTPRPGAQCGPQRRRPIAEQHRRHDDGKDARQFRHGQFRERRRMHASPTPTMLRPPTSDPEHAARTISAARRELLARIARWLDIPMLVLSFSWLVLLIWELTRAWKVRAGCSPPSPAPWSRSRASPFPSPSWRRSRPARHAECGQRRLYVTAAPASWAARWFTASITSSAITCSTRFSCSANCRGFVSSTQSAPSVWPAAVRSGAPA